MVIGGFADLEIRFQGTGGALIFLFGTLIFFWMVFSDTRWLQGTYRINIEWWMLGAACFILIRIPLLKGSYYSINTAVINPVKSMRAD